MLTEGAKILGPGQGRAGRLGGMGVRFVLEGRIGAMLGDQVVFGEPGDLIFKPRDQWHTFWNAGEAEARLLEIISPAGFERYFEELVELFVGGRPAPEVLAEVRSRYGLETDPSSIAGLVAEHDLIFE